MSKPKETREFNGKQYVLEEAIFGDYALIKVHKADKLGNCRFRMAMNNFNEAMAKNAKVTIVEADEIVEVGEIAPEDVHLQGIYVNKVIKSTVEKKIEKLVFAKDPNAMLEGGESQVISVLSIGYSWLIHLIQARVTPPHAVNASSSGLRRSSRTECTLTWVSECRLLLLPSFLRTLRLSFSLRMVSWVLEATLNPVRKTRTSSTLVKRLSLWVAERLCLDPMRALE